MAAITFSRAREYKRAAYDLTIDYCLHETKYFINAYDVNDSFSYKPLIRVFQFPRYFDTEYDPIEDRIRESDFSIYFQNFYGYHKNVFSTFIGDMVVNFGKKNTLIYSIVFSVLFSLLFKSFSPSIG